MGWAERYLVWFLDACSAPEQGCKIAGMPPFADPVLALIALSAAAWCYLIKKEGVRAGTR